MIELDTLSVILLSELFLILALSVVVLVWGNARRRRRDRQAALHLVGVIKENEQRRLAEAREMLEKRYGYDGDRLEQTAHGLNKAEKLLYQRVLNTYVKRDTGALRQLNIQVEGVTDAYRALDVPAGGGATVATSADAEGEGASGEEVERLRKENAALKQELQITMETMGRMLSEYAAMFGGGPQAQMDKAQMLGMLEEEEAESTDEDVDSGDGREEIEELEIPVQGDGMPSDLEELLDAAAPGGEAAPGEADETVVLETRTAGAGVESEDAVDLAADFDDLLAAEEPAEEEAGAETDSDAELDDIWAQALAESAAAEKKTE